LYFAEDVEDVVDGCTLDIDGCNGDPDATCSGGYDTNSRTCTCSAGFTGTATLTDDESFGGCIGMCTQYDVCRLLLRCAIVAVTWLFQSSREKRLPAP
jgi:hypothetical protein